MELSPREAVERVWGLEGKWASGACEVSVAQMGWEQRGNNRYYYKKEREGSKVKSIYVGRGEMAHMISQFQASSTVLERLTRAKQAVELNKTESVFELAVELIQMVAHAALLSAGFHTHKRQWRKKRDGRH